MTGSTLYPLNQLKEKLPEVYQKEVKKYTGREQVMEHRIPGLDCLWNGVLHLTAVHPANIKQALIEAGHEIDFALDYYQIEPETLEPEKTVIYLYNYTEKENKFEPDNFAPYDPSKLEQYARVPEETKAYYRQAAEQGELPLFYHHIPHILYQDSLEVENLPIVSV